ncbi:MULTISPECIES: serine hydrolase domain-containing protein [Rhodomicrobium]|uniref:serine hydrolase domain-containing protein n=1 Tax=Rhodomicrobium TaxID=1068 RepID=UPI000B4AB034|nr:MULTISPECIES: serine hydrolase domain-containing protein [Rhodomicrobium]
MRLRSPAVFAFFVLLALSFSPASARDVTLSKGTAEDVGMSSQRLEKITQAFSREIAEKRLPGAVILIARDGKIVYENSFGTLAPNGNTPMPKDAIFRIYSMTKPLMSVGLMLLVEDGLVELTDPVSKFLPAFKDVQVSTPEGDVAPVRPMTIQDLLRHTAGLAYGELTKNQKVKDAFIAAGLAKANVEYDARDLTGPEEVERLAKIPLVNQPGSLWEYSLAVDVQGRVIEAVTGKRAGAFLAERIFQPLKMHDTGFSVPQANLARVAAPFETDPASGKSFPVIDISKEPGNDSGGAGGVSTAIDYLRFCQMLLNGGTLDGARILSPSTIKLMTSDHLATLVSNPQAPGELLLGSKGYTFGLGFAVRLADGIAGVPGSAGEFMWAGYAGTYFWVDPREGITAVYMTQAPSPSRSYYRKLLKQLVYQSITELRN